jgi:hypothetical protein
MLAYVVSPADSASIASYDTANKVRQILHSKRQTPHVTRRTSHITPRQTTRHTSHHTSYVIRHTSHVTRLTSHVTRHQKNYATAKACPQDCALRQQQLYCRNVRPCSGTLQRTSHVTRHTSHITHHTSHVTRHTSHVTSHTSRHTSHITHHAPPVLEVDAKSRTRLRMKKRLIPKKAATFNAKNWL